MDEKLYGVFFRDAEGAVYLAAVLGGEDEAIEEGFGGEKCPYPS